MHAYIKCGSIIIIIVCLQARILVTHSIGFLPQFDRIVVLVEGRVTETGTYTELIENNGAFSEFLRNYSNMNNEETVSQSGW